MKYDLDKSLGIYRRFTPPRLPGPLLRLANFALRRMPKGLRGVRVQRVRVCGVRCLLIRPTGAEGRLPLLIYYHGGGFMFAAAGYHYANALQYAKGAGCAVLLPDYPLAPTARLGDICQSCFNVYCAAHSLAGEWGCDGSRIAVGGDSAGGFIAADIICRAHAAAVALPVFALLIYPVADSRGDYPSKRAFTHTPMWNSRLNGRMWRMAGEAASPIDYARLECFPPTYIETVEFDCLRGEGEELCRRLKKAGVQVWHNFVARAMHGFDIARRSPIAVAAVQSRVKALNEALYGR